jgi:hypothetical protein
VHTWLRQGLKRVAPGGAPQKQQSPAGKSSGTPTPTTSPGTDAKNRGRPKEDLTNRCEKLWHDFQNATSTNVRFFGAERKTQLKTMTRLINDINTAVNESSDADQARKLSIAAKKTNAVIALCKGFHKQAGFAAGFDEVVHFSNMAPVTNDWPCPDWMHRMRYTMRVTSTDKADEFWSLLGPIEMKKAKVPESEYFKMQVELVSGQVVNIVRTDDGNVKDKLAELGAVVESSFLDLDLKPEIRENMRQVCLLCTYDKPGAKPDDIDVAVDFVDEVSNNVAHAMMAFPAGRKVHEAAAAHAAHLRTTHRTLRTATALLEDLDTVLPAGGAVDMKALVSAMKVCDAKLDAEDLAKKPDILEHALHCTWNPFPCLIMRGLPSVKAKIMVFQRRYLGWDCLACGKTAGDRIIENTIYKVFLGSRCPASFLEFGLVKLFLLRGQFHKFELWEESRTTSTRENLGNCVFSYLFSW